MYSLRVKLHRYVYSSRLMPPLRPVMNGVPSAYTLPSRLCPLVPFERAGFFWNLCEALWSLCLLEPACGRPRGQEV